MTLVRMPRSGPPPFGMLVETAEGLLGLTISCLTEAGLTVPPRQLVYPGQIPADCEMIGVLFTGWSASSYLRETASGMLTCQDYLWAAAYSVVIVRCTPAMPKKSGQAPTAESMVDAAKIASADCEALTCVVSGAGDHGADVAVTCAAPSGGYQTAELDITLPYGALT